MKRRIQTIMTVLLLTVAVVGSNLVFTNASIDESVKRPTIESKSALLYSMTTDEVIFSKNADTKIEPYSTTKLMTALLVCENMEDLDTTVTVSEKAASFDGSTMYLQKGEKVTIRQLLYGTLLLSGNDAAYALAEACGKAMGGDVSTFIEMMNEKAKELGCTGTHFANPNGIQAKSHYTTAEDFAKITQAALENELVREIAGTKKYKMAKTNKSDAYDMETHLDLIETEGSGVVAGKTGYWEDDDCSVALMYDKGGLEMILVLFGSNIETREDDAADILEYAEMAIAHYDATNPNTAVEQARIRGGAVVRNDVYPTETIVAYPEDGSEESITTQCKYDEDIEAPLEAGDEVGVCEVYCNGEKIGETTLIVKDAVEKGWFPSQWYISNNMALVIGGILVLLVLIILFLLHQRKKKKMTGTDGGYQSKH